MLKHPIARQILYRKIHIKVGEQMKIHSASVEMFVEACRNFISEYSCLSEDVSRITFLHLGFVR